MSPPGDIVRVRVRSGRDRARVEIQDGGPGLPQGLEGASGRAASRNGSGYGLLAARRFLEANGGDLSFERPPGGGTLCIVTLGLARAGEPHAIQA